MCSWNAADRLASNACGSVVAVRGKVSSTATLTPPWGPPPGSAAEKTATIVFALSYYSSSKYVLTCSCGHRYYKLTYYLYAMIIMNLTMYSSIVNVACFSLTHTHKMHRRCASHLGFWRRNISVCVTLTRMENHCGWISATRYTSSWFQHPATDLLWKWEWSTLSGLRKSYRQSPGEAQVATLEYFELGLVNWLVIGAN